VTEHDTTLKTGRPAFDTGRLDRLMEEAGLDVLVASSKHNARYLMGGYTFFFFATMQAIGHSRYLPMVIYVRGDLDRAAYIGHGMENYETALSPFWTPTVENASSTSTESAERAVAHIRRIGQAGGRIGVEAAFLPADAHRVLADGLDGARLLDATGPLERLRALKTPAELALLRQATERITEAMVATIAWAGEGTSKREIVEKLRREETDRGLEFDYCLITMGADPNRAASDQRWRPGEPLSLDSGGNLDGYIGDICRMGVLGAPDAELEDLLAAVDTIQQAAFAAVRAGAPGGAVIAGGADALAASPVAGFTDFVAHGMGLVSHEVPFLVKNRMYDAADADRPLEAGMVLSVETTAVHPKRGFIKLEDTVAVTADGYELFGDSHRGWNRSGAG
jgi:Xaa-Pro aminopeptidase